MGPVLRGRTGRVGLLYIVGSRKARGVADEIAIITGAGQGIGRATALCLAARGARLVLNARSVADLESVRAEVQAAGGAAILVAGDAGDQAIMQQLVRAAQEEYGAPTAVVTCAGLAPLAKLTQLPIGTFDQMLTLNVRAVFLLTKIAWPVMAAGGGGAFVHVSSMGSVDPFPGFAAYGGSKAFVNTFVKGLASEGTDVGIRLYAVAPGAVDTRMLRGLFPDFPPDQRLRPDEVAAEIDALIRGETAHPSGDTIFLSRDAS